MVLKVLLVALFLKCSLNELNSFVIVMTIQILNIFHVWLLSPGERGMEDILSALTELILMRQSNMEKQQAAT